MRNERFIRALLRQPVDVTPVWLMRQAGRYLPEYRATRQRAGSFMTLCKTPELACEVTLQPLERYDLDAAILFSDILTIPDAMGLGLSVEDGVGPRFERPVRSNADIDAVGIPDPNDQLTYVMDAVRLIRAELHGQVPLIGFAGSPWTLATYMVEGGGSRDFRSIKNLLYSDPNALHRLLAKLADAVTHYLNAQIEAGVQAVMVFDTWGGILTSRDYQTFSLHYLQRIAQGLTRVQATTPVPSIVFTKGGGQWLQQIAASGYDCVGLDWTTAINQAKSAVGDKVALQGNMDPDCLYAPADRIREEVKTIIQAYGGTTGHVFNLGHGITPQVNPDNVKVLVDSVHEFGRQPAAA